MSIAARTETSEQRDAIFKALASRNRTVSMLRVGLPVIGALVFLTLALQFFLGALVPDFGFANIKIDRDNLVVESPSYAGIGEDGTAYSFTAEAARGALSSSDLIHLAGAVMNSKDPDGSTFVAKAANADLRLSSQVVTVAGWMEVASDDGMAGKIGDPVIDLTKETLTAPGGADLMLDKTTRLEAATMDVDGVKKLWTFTRVTVTFNETPGESAYVAGRDGGTKAVSP
jgi:hypothetical protein